MKFPYCSVNMSKLAFDLYNVWAGVVCEEVEHACVGVWNNVNIWRYNTMIYLCIRQVKAG